MNDLLGMEERRLIYYIIALIVIALDQISKWMIARSMEIGESIEVVHNFFYITSHRNQGAAFGILQGKMWFFYIITVVVIIAIVYYLEKEGKYNRLFGTALGLILGGAIGNFIDRVWRGEVVDFVDTIYFGYNFAIFNVADAALSIGVVLIIIHVMLDERRKKKVQS